MAMLQRPFIIVTGVRSQITQSPQMDGDQWIEGGEGVRGRMDHFGMLDFEGRPNNRMRDPQTEHKIVALTLSDLVILRDRMTKMIAKAVRDGVLDLSSYSGLEGLPAGGQDPRIAQMERVVDELRRDPDATLDGALGAIVDVLTGAGDR